MRDDDVRSSCFASLDVLCARFGEEVPYPQALAEGFNFRGRRVPFLSTQKGIFRAGAQNGPAALSIQTSWKSPYGDTETETGYRYAYRAGSIDQPDNRALRAAFELRVPIVHFVATRPNYYRPIYPCFVMEDDPVAGLVLVSPGKMVGPLDEQEPAVLEDPLERQYKFRETRIRVHQARFRGRVIPAYRNLCAICRLKEPRLLDAAHIVGDLEMHGQPVVANGLSLCSIHHRAFDEDLVGISPDYEVKVSRRLREEEDGPMLEVLKGFHDLPIELPRRPAWRPDRKRLAERFERFLAAG
ncbi:MAG TPA: HNH endonuclease [Gemmatimonadaceae bacterium]|nr:HNH endonuclease [Gemmatimonadaceae bacterium]